jgi:hypothetical protein
MNKEISTMATKVAQSHRGAIVCIEVFENVVRQTEQVLHLALSALTLHTPGRSLLPTQQFFMVY